MAEFKLPELGENVDEAEVIRLLVSEGDEIEADQSVMEVESDKAATSLPCPIAGKVGKIHVSPGDTIKPGQTLLTIEETQAPAEEEEEAQAEEEEEAQAEEEEEPAAEEDEEAPEEEKPQKKPRPKKVKPGSNGRKSRQEEEEAEPEKPRRKEKKEAPALEKKESKDAPIPAGPATRRMARVMEVDLTRVKGTGPHGTITFEDVKAAAEGAAPLPDFGKWGKVRRERMNQIAKRTAENVSRSWRLVPHVTQHDCADVTQLEAARKRYNDQKAEDEPKLTMTAFVIKAVVSVLKDFPRFNSSFDAATKEIIIKDYYHVGVAVDTEEGLVVPVMRDVESKKTKEIAGGLAELARQARDRELSADDMRGGTFTVTNLGGIGGTYFTPIVNYPEVAILGIGEAQWLRDDGDGDKRLHLPLSLSYDHRVINGADGARFIRKVAELLSDPSDFLIES